MSDESLTVLLIGHSESPHARPVLESLDGCRLVRARTIAAAINDADADQADLIVVYQSIPDEFSREQVTRLIDAWPLTRCVVCFGPWCESIGRTEQVWPVAWCVSVKSSPARILAERNPDASEVRLLPTMSRDESFAHDVTQLPMTAEVSAPRRIAVVGDDRALEETVLQFLSDSGHLPGPVREADTVLLLVTLPTGTPGELVEELTRECMNQPEIILASDLATEPQMRQLHARHSARVISQVRLFADLVAALSSTSRSDQLQSGAA